mgnify:FL=1
MTESNIEIGGLSMKGRVYALILGPLLGLLTFYLLPDSYQDAAGKTVAFAYAGKACLAVTVWMAVWWFTEALPIAATALIPLVVYPLFNITTASAAMTNYASGTIFLFLGGFLLAAAIHRWHLDRRIALTMLTIFGTKPNQMVLGLMVATGFLSAWVSNTATAAMMVPIAVAVMGVIRSTQDSPEISSDERNFGVAVLLGIAYAASIGGMATLIGSPPNGIYARFVEQTYHEPVTFVQWMELGLPVTLLLLPVAYLLLTRVLFPSKLNAIPGGREWVRKELKKLGPMSRGEKIVLAVFLCAALLWVFGPVIRDLDVGGQKPFKALSDTVIAMGAGLVLFMIPVDIKRGIHALDWNSTKDVVAWDVLLLFGGGLTMAAAIQKTGAAALIGAQASILAGTGEVAMMAGVATLVTFATEVTSNTALAATMMPLIAAAADSLKIAPEGLLVTTAIAASCAFMMPVATPPNAIVFGTGRLKIGDMVKAGFFLNIIGVIVVVLVCSLLSPYVFAH